MSEQDHDDAQLPGAQPPDRFDPDFVPGEWEIEGPAVSISLGDAADLDPALLAAICEPDGPGLEALGAAFGQDGAADVLRPGPVLLALSEQAAADPAALTDDELMGALRAACRLENQAMYLQTVAVAEFARRRAAQLAAADARKVRPGRRPGEFPDAELAAELLITQAQAGNRIASAASLTARLPRVLAGLAGGTIDYDRAATIAYYTASLSDADAARADEILAPAAPGLRGDQLARKAAALEMRLDPEAAKARKERAAKHDRRVEVRREDSGNASIAGRELPVADVMASKAHIDAIAARLRAAGLDGTLNHLRALALTELTQGRNPLDLITPADPATTPRPATPGATAPDTAAPDTAAPNAATGGTAASDAVTTGAVTTGAVTTGAVTTGAVTTGAVFPGSAPADGASARPGEDEDWDGYNEDEDGDDEDDGPGGTPRSPSGPGRPGTPGTPGSAGRPGAPGRRSAPMPSLINLIVPVGALLGWSAAPAQAAGWGLLDPEDTRDIVAAASQHPRTRWCVTVTGSDGTAIAHGCSRGQHPWTPQDPQESPHHHRPPGPSDPHSPPSPHRPSDPRSAPDREPPHNHVSRPGDGPDPARAAQLRDLLGRLNIDRDLLGRLNIDRDLLGRLNINLEPIARGECDHRNAEDRYTPSRKLQHLVRARTATCTAPGCGAQAVHCDADHTIAYPEGMTCQCNLGPKCRRHHRVKQAPGWRVEQPQPGIMRWTTPSGRTHTTTPTVYDH